MLEILKSFVSNPFLYFGVLITITAVFIGFLFIGDKPKDTEEFDDEEIELPEKSQKIEKTNKIEKNDKVEKSLTEDQIKARAELDRVIMQMEQDLNEKENTTIDQFEKEQEENAIISYQELLRTVQKENLVEEIQVPNAIENHTSSIELIEPASEDLKENIQISLDDLELDQEVESAKIELEELFQTVDDTDSIIDSSIVESSIKENNLRENMFTEISTPQDEKIKPKIKEKPEKGFRNTSFISPVFGVVDNKIEYPTIPSREKMAKRAQNDHILELEKTLNLEPITEEIRKNDAFLQALKEFRKNLD